MNIKFYPKEAHFEHKSQVCPNSLVFHRGLSDAAKLLLLALNGIATNTRTWKIIQCDVQARLGWGRDKMRDAMRCCIQFGYMKVKQARCLQKDQNSKKGQWAHNEFEFDMEGKYMPAHTFQSEDVFSACGQEPSSPKTCFPPTENPPLPKPNPVPGLDIPKGNAPYPQIDKQNGDGKAMPFHSKDSGNGDAKVIPSITRKFKRKQDHQERFDYLMSLCLTDKNGLVSEDEMSYLSHTYSMQKLKDTSAHMEFKLQNGKPAKCRVAFFKHLLTKEHNARGSNSDTNAEYARSFSKEMGWSSIKIGDKYVSDPIFPGKELPLNMDSMTFFGSLVEMFHSIEGR